MARAHEFGPGELEKFFNKVLKLNEKMDKSVKDAGDVLYQIKELKEGFAGIDDFIQFYKILLRILFVYAKAGGRYERKYIELMKQRAPARIDWPDIYLQLKEMINIIKKPNAKLKKIMEKDEKAAKFIRYWSSGSELKTLNEINIDLEKMQSYFHDLSKIFTQGAVDLGQKIKHTVREAYSGRYSYKYGLIGLAIERLEIEPIEIVWSYYKAWEIETIPGYYRNFDSLLNHVRQRKNILGQKYVKLSSSGKSKTSLDPLMDLGKLMGLQICIDLGIESKSEIQKYVDYFDGLFRLEQTLIQFAKIVATTGEIQGIGRISTEYAAKAIRLDISKDNSWRSISKKINSLIKLWKNQFKGFKGKGSTEISSSLKDMEKAYKDLDEAMHYIYELLR